MVILTKIQVDHLVDQDRAIVRVEKIQHVPHSKICLPIMKTSIVAILIISSTFFAATAQQFENQADSTSYFCFYRPFKLLGMAIKYDVFVNQTKVCRLGVRRVCKIPITKVGKTEVWAKTEIPKGLIVNVMRG